MKKVYVVCVGKIKEKFFVEGIEEYKKRVSRFAELNFIEIKDFPTPDEIKRECDLILPKLQGYVILLDIGGKTLSSEELAEHMERAYLTQPVVTFVIGGSEGVDERVRLRADLRLSFGRVTFPHQLMRLMLSEQIYRAFTITEGLPYHK